MHMYVADQSTLLFAEISFNMPLCIDAVAAISNESPSPLMMFEIAGANLRYESYSFIIVSSLCIKHNYNSGEHVPVIQ